MAAGVTAAMPLAKLGLQPATVVRPHPCSRLRLYSDKVVAKWTAGGSSAGPVLVMCSGRAGVWGAVGTSVASLVDGGSLQAF